MSLKLLFCEDPVLARKEQLQQSDGCLNDTSDCHRKQALGHRNITAAQTSEGTALMYCVLLVCVLL